MTPFEYQKAGSVEEALTAIANGESKLLAGGHSLIPGMKLRLNRPSRLVDISKIESLKEIREFNSEITIGAAVTHHQIATDPIIHKHLTFFAEAAEMIGDLQVRNYGTIGGSLAHADPAADWPALLMATDASIDIAAPDGNRSVKADSFFTGLYSTVLKENEMITAIRILVPPPGSEGVYLKFRQPASRFAIVGCAVFRTIDGHTQVAFTGISEHAFRDEAVENTIAGQPLNTAIIEKAAELAINGITVNSDLFASAEYRKHLAKVYLRRALEKLKSKTNGISD